MGRRLPKTQPAAQWSPSHLERSRRVVEHDLKRLHAVRADRLTAEHVERLFARREANGAALDSLRKVRNALSGAFTLAIRRRVLPPYANGAKLAQLPKGGEEPPSSKCRRPCSWRRRAKP